MAAKRTRAKEQGGAGFGRARQALRRCTAPAAAAGEASPSMAQFLEIKAANPDSLLWYRMGDFYELFFEDAVVASAALGIVLTKRGKHLGQDIPMCGVPIHRADEYLQRLIRLGYRVAVAEQLEDPAEARKRGSKAVVRRDVVRLVTPGTLTEDTLLDSKARNYLTALFVRGARRGAIAAVRSHGGARLARHLDGRVRGGRGQRRRPAGRARAAGPSEVILVDALLGDDGLKRWIELAGAAATPVPAAYFDSLAGEAKPERAAEGRRAWRLRRLHAARARRHRRGAQVRRADADGRAGRVLRAPKQVRLRVRAR